jgi:hypothetical protein
MLYEAVLLLLLSVLLVAESPLLDPVELSEALDFVSVSPTLELEDERLLPDGERWSVA